MIKIIRNARITDAGSSHNGKTLDILIENGVVTQIGKSLKSPSGAEEISVANLHVSLGWFDPTVHFCDPGEEYKEDLSSGMRAAAAGGFTGVGLLPVTHPPISGKSQVDYVLKKSQGGSVEIVPYGTLSAGLDHENLSEMVDMYRAGARGFTDYLSPVNAGLLLRAMQYSQDMGAVIFSHPADKSLMHGGLMHEGSMNVRLGLKGIPAMAEEIAVMRDIALVAYNQSPLHLLNISTSGSVEQIRAARKKGLPVTCQVSVQHLFFSDADLSDFDTHLKIDPPLRSQADIDALIKGLADGTIDCVTSDHFPQDTESKKVEFDQALPGSIALEAAFGALRTATRKMLKTEELVSILAINPRKILGLRIPAIEEGMQVNLTLFDPDESYVFTREMQKSKGINCPYIGKTLTGKVYGAMLAM